MALATWLLGALSRTLETPVYRATALIQIDWEKINLVEDVMVNPTRGMADLYGTQEKIVKSRLLSELVVDDLELWTHPLFAPASKDLADQKSRTRAIARSIQGMIDVRRVEKTQLMEVSFVTPDPDLSAELVNSLVEQYIQFNVDSESGLARGTSEFIDEEVEELRRDIMNKEKFLRDGARNKAHGDGRQRRQHRHAAARDPEPSAHGGGGGAGRGGGEVPKHLPRRPSQHGRGAEQHGGARARAEALSLTEKYEELSSTFGPDWPEMKRIKNAIAEVERSLDQTVTR